MNKVYYAVLVCIIAAFPALSFATPEAPSKPAAEQPSAPNFNEEQLKEQLKPLVARMVSDPADLDAYHDYGKITAKNGLLHQAATAYSHILTQNPKLERIKLSLALVYIRMGKLVEAKGLLLEALAAKPPAKVVENINTTLATIEKALGDQSKNPPPQEQGVAEAQTAAQGEKTPEPELAATTPPPPQKKLTRTEKKAQKAALKEKKKAMEEQWAKLAKETADNPDNLDTLFAYGQLSTQLGKLEEAIKAYERMLEVKPDLERVKLDLGMLYAQTTRYSKAKAKFEEVLAKNPPDAVKQNITAVIASLDKATKRNTISGSVSLGFTVDTNANSAASSNQTTFSDVSIPLDPSSAAQKDSQGMGTVSLTHTYKFLTETPKYGLSIATTGTYYRTQQEEQNALDISLLSLKTGPTLSLPKLKSQFSISESLSLVRLNSNAYTRTGTSEFAWKFTPTARLMLDTAITREDREYSNTVVSTTNTNRSGPADQQKFSVTYVLTPKDVLNTTFTWRGEDAAADQYGLDQLGCTASYTRVLPYNLTFNALYSFKKSHYNNFDETVSTEKIRNDRERGYTLTLIKKLPKNLSLSTSYQYKNSTSNIENYDYSNHKGTVTLSWSF